MTRKLIAALLAVLMIVGALASFAVAEDKPYWMPEWDMEADVVVVGFGPAGAAAAKSAMDNGASVLVVEKENKEYAGGSSAVSGGIVVHQTVEQIYDSSMGRLTMENAQRIVDRAFEGVDWLTENGLEVQGRSTVGAGPAFYQAVVKASEANGTPVLYETPAKKLVFDPQTHEVFGIECVNAEGEALYIKANKGVILCTGGYVANKELMNRFHFPDMLDYATVGAPNQNGDGLLMALEAGAGLDGITNQQIEWYGYSYKVASEEMGTGILHMIGSNSPDSRIFVNAKGERFMNEEERVVHSKSQLAFLDYNGTYPAYSGYTNLPMYVIFDEAMFNGGAVGPLGDYYVGYATHHDIHIWSEDNQAELERGWLVKADTIEELVVKLAEQSGNEQIDAQVLTETIATYNAYCEQGVDEAFGRESFYLDPIGEGPYYAAQIVPTAVYTIGGLTGGENGETLDWNGNPIPRLYHAGDIGQPAKTLISALQGCLALGDIAGEACSQLESH